MSIHNRLFLSIMLIGLAGSGHSLGYSGNEPVEIILRTEVQVDLFFHCLAHLDIGQDASSLYSETYVHRISREKNQQGLDPAWLTGEMAKIRDIYVCDQKLRMVNFIPFLFKSVDQLLAGLEWLSTNLEGNSPQELLPYFKQEFFSSLDSRRFLRSFAGILEAEHLNFYLRYWEHQQGRLGALKARFRSLWEEAGIKLMRPVMEEKQGVVVYLCLSMTRNGRGFAMGKYFGAAVKFPEKEDEIMESFWMSIHEITHLFLDKWTLHQHENPNATSSTLSGDEGYDVHLFKERAVLYADYLLCRTIVPALLPDYLQLFLELLGEEKRADLASLPRAELEKLFKARVPLPEKTVQMLETFIYGFLNSR